jgi:hypothetical protein
MSLWEMEEKACLCILNKQEDKSKDLRAERHPKPRKTISQKK